MSLVIGQNGEERERWVSALESTIRHFKQPLQVNNFNHYILILFLNYKEIRFKFNPIKESIKFRESFVDMRQLLYIADSAN